MRHTRSPGRIRDVFTAPLANASSRFRPRPAAPDKCGRLLPAPRDCASPRHRRPLHRPASSAGSAGSDSGLTTTLAGETRVTRPTRSPRCRGARPLHHRLVIGSGQEERTEPARIHLLQFGLHTARSTGCSRPAHASSTAFRYARVVSATYSASLYRPSILSAEMPMRTISGTCSSAYRSPGESR